MMEMMLNAMFSTDGIEACMKKHVKQLQRFDAVPGGSFYLHGTTSFTIARQDDIESCRSHRRSEAILQSKTKLGRGYVVG